MARQAYAARGTFKLTNGTGKYKGRTLTGTFSGALADGVHSFDYAGRYK
jgi:hypothetical protein